jgi:diguanylate cyclase (GGDEF)-like protein/PAS domain S-box-containing protein
LSVSPEEVMSARSRPRGALIPCSREGTAREAVDLVVVSSAGHHSRDGGALEDARRYRTLIEQLPLIVYVDALDATSSNIFTSRQIEPILGYSVDEWRTEQGLFLRALHPDDRDRVVAAHAHTHRTHDPLSIEYRLFARDGRVVWLRDEGVVVVDDDGRPMYLQGYLLDVTEQREAEEQLRQLALYDGLTGLANRAFFHERLVHAVSLRREPSLHAGLLFIDLDGFKNVNDRWGHDAGDEVLRVMARRIEENIRAGDTAARLGGDEFAVVLTAGVQPGDALAIAERLLNDIARPVDVEDAQLAARASIGIALGSDVETMLREADIAMYRAKAQPELGYAFFDPVLDSSAAKRSHRIGELREAVDRREFRLDYQPIVELDEHEIIGYEALVRWNHPVEGELPPAEFIALAEETGVIIRLGEWVLEEACAEGGRLIRAHGHDVQMSVNVSARQLHHPEFPEHVERALEMSDFPASSLVLELTESTLLGSGEQVAATLQKLKELGAVLALDDFGTGYASLAYLQQFPIDTVKIDRSFTAAIDGPSADTVLLKGIIDLGNALDLNLIAEGIETPIQHSIVRRLGCHRAQGFYFGPPAAIAQRTLRFGSMRVA